MRVETSVYEDFEIMVFYFLFDIFIFSKLMHLIRLNHTFKFLDKARDITK